MLSMAFTVENGLWDFSEEELDKIGRLVCGRVRSQIQGSIF